MQSLGTSGASQGSGAAKEGSGSKPAELTTVPFISSWTSFTSIAEVFRYDTSNQMTFSRTTFTLLDTENDHTVYFGKIDAPKRDISLDQARRCLDRVPDEAIYPSLPPELAAYALDHAEPTQYLKRPKFTSYQWFTGTTIAAERFLEEAQTLDLLRQHPHPNIGRCQGYLVSRSKGSRMVGLVLQRYSVTLDERVNKTSQGPFGAAACFGGIAAAVTHLHRLDIAHNDLNPSNIMLDEQVHAVLVDMGSCKPFGETLTEAGTMKWNEGFDEVASRNNDEIGLRKIQEWLGLHADDKESTLV